MNGFKTFQSDLASSKERSCSLLVSKLRKEAYSMTTFEDVASMNEELERIFLKCSSIGSVTSEMILLQEMDKARTLDEKDEAKLLSWLVPGPVGIVFLSGPSFLWLAHGYNAIHCGHEAHYLYPLISMSCLYGIVVIVQRIARIDRYRESCSRYWAWMKLAAKKFEHEHERRQNEKREKREHKNCVDRAS
jgi:hypothetical protein